MGDIAGVKNLIKAGEADICGRGATQRQWTPLHIAVWGTAKPAADKDIVEALLLAASRAAPTSASAFSPAAQDGFGVPISTSAPTRSVTLLMATTRTAYCDIVAAATLVVQGAASHVCSAVAQNACDPFVRLPYSTR